MDIAKQIIAEKDKGLAEMAKDIIKIEGTLGKDHNLVQKLKTIYESIEGLTIPDLNMRLIVMLSSVTNTLMEQSGSVC